MVTSEMPRRCPVSLLYILLPNAVIHTVFSGVVGIIYHRMHQCIVKGCIRDLTCSKPTCAACARVLIQVCLMNGQECKHVGTIPTADYNALMASVYKM